MLAGWGITTPQSCAVATPHIHTSWKICWTMGRHCVVQWSVGPGWHLEKLQISTATRGPTIVKAACLLMDTQACSVRSWAGLT